MKPKQGIWQGHLAWVTMWFVILGPTGHLQQLKIERILKAAEKKIIDKKEAP